MEFLIEPRELRDALSDKQRQKARPIYLIDVREPEEHELVAIPGSRLIPLMTIPDHIETLRELSQKGSNELIVYCRSGQRSQMALEFLVQNSLTNIKNLRGGINAYAKEADSSLKPY